MGGQGSEGKDCAPHGKGQIGLWVSTEPPGMSLPRQGLPQQSAPLGKGTAEGPWGWRPPANSKPIHTTRALPTTFLRGQPVDTNAWKSFCPHPELSASASKEMPSFGFLLCRAADPGGPGQLLPREPCLQQSCQPQGRLGDSWEQDVSQPAKFNPPTLARLKIGSLQHR